MNAVSYENGQSGLSLVKQNTPVYVRIDKEEPIFINELKIPIDHAFYGDGRWIRDEYTDRLTAILISVNPIVMINTRGNASP